LLAVFELAEMYYAPNVRGGKAMHRQGFWRLYARLVSIQRAARDRTTAHGDITGTQVSPLLTFTAAALFLILAILEIDLHREQLRALGLISGEGDIEPIWG
jgi:hypothetical protein